ncbi:MAG: CPBP family intramembrane metalloprotease [Blastomonas sp.]|uniref:CPBP family glutamic-type intramembrane protease n=1 Tax=Blastomonas sp. TaxID=1909299 RepID=UPI00258A39F8|nr:CPBP family intramembrane glutamic endopeptidase [Blastomonas sp.]MCO5791919.1 CPBP family intramembrane metalloprotease [Blastomonas sp.]
MNRFSHRRPVLAFYLLALLIASLVMVWTVYRFTTDPASAGMLGEMVTGIYASGQYINIASMLPHALARPDLLGVFIFAAAPSISAVIVAARGGGGGLEVLAGRLRPVGANTTRRRAIAVYCGMLAVYAAGFAAYDFVAGPGTTITDRLAMFGGSVLLGAAVGLLMDEGGTLEELGWRGFAWPLLQAAMKHPLRAAMLLGTLHWAWHLPREVLTLLGGVDPGSFLLTQGVFWALCLALAVVAGYCVNLAGGSVWPAVLVHGGTNLWSKALSDHVAPSFGLIDLRTLILFMLALVIALCAGRQLGRLPGNPAREPE